MDKIGKLIRWLPVVFYLALVLFYGLWVCGRLG